MTDREAKEHGLAAARRHTVSCITVRVCDLRMDGGEVSWVEVPEASVVATKRAREVAIQRLEAKRDRP